MDDFMKIFLLTISSFIVVGGLFLAGCTSEEDKTEPEEPTTIKDSNLFHSEVKYITKDNWMGVYRLENDEVVCYAITRSISCIKKEGK